MTAVDWPAWMPEPPHLDCDGPDVPDCGKCRASLLAWYAAAKAADPMVHPPHQSGVYVPSPVRPSDPETFDARVRAAFPLPEDTAPPGWRRTPGQVGGDDLILERDDRVVPLRFPDSRLLTAVPGSDRLEGPELPCPRSTAPGAESTR